MPHNAPDAINRTFTARDINICLFRIFLDEMIMTDTAKARLLLTGTSTSHIGREIYGFLGSTAAHSPTIQLTMTIAK